eukprot:2897938-Rhodomonas_salina.4
MGSGRVGQYHALGVLGSERPRSRLFVLQEGKSARRAGRRRECGTCPGTLGWSAGAWGRSIGAYPGDRVEELRARVGGHRGGVKGRVLHWLSRPLRHQYPASRTGTAQVTSSV